jgi:hypothetical protein
MSISGGREIMEQWESALQFIEAGLVVRRGENFQIRGYNE